MYATVDDVIREMGKFGEYLTDTSKPTKTDVTNNTLPDISSEIDGVLSGRGLTIPVTEPDTFLKQLSSLNALGAAARVVAALFPQAAGPASTTFHEWLQARYDAGLKRLAEGELPSAAPNDDQLLPRSYATSHPDDETTAPVFTRGMQW